MIPIPSSVRVWIATGHTDMQRGMQGLALQVQESLKRDPHAGDLYIFRGRRGDLAKILWHDGIGLSLYAKRLDRGKFIWPSASDGAVSIWAAQMAYMLEGIDWRNPQPDVAAQKRRAPQITQIMIYFVMDAARAALAQENADLKAALAVAQPGLEVAAELAVARAKASEDMALIGQQKLRIAKLERQVTGSGRSARRGD